ALPDREESNAPAIVIGDENNASRPIDADVARTRALRRLLSEASERAVARDREGAHTTAALPEAFGDFVHRVEHAAVRMDGEERRIRSGIDTPEQPERSRSRVELDKRDPLGALRVGVAADVEQLLLVRHAGEWRNAGHAEEPERGR